MARIVGVDDGGAGVETIVETGAGATGLDATGVSYDTGGGGAMRCDDGVSLGGELMLHAVDTWNQCSSTSAAPARPITPTLSPKTMKTHLFRARSPPYRAKITNFPCFLSLHGFCSRSVLALTTSVVNVAHTQLYSY